MLRSNTSRFLYNRAYCLSRWNHAKPCSGRMAFVYGTSTMNVSSTVSDAKARGHMMVLLMGGGLLAGVFEATKHLRCEEAAVPSSQLDDEVERDIAYILLHPHDEDIDEVVTEILNDPDINLSIIPDAIESCIYRSTIQLTLSIIYSILGSVDGTDLLSHEIRIRKLPRDNGATDAPIYSKGTRKINDAILEQVADRLLANRAINSLMIPDVIERQIYINCIKIIFRTFTAVLEGFCLSICGHELRMSLSAAEAATRIEKAMSSLSEIDLELLRQYARESGVAESTLEPSWWEKMFWNGEFSVQLHASMYGLVLGIVDDILANTKINVLGDTMEFDIVPQSDKAKRDAALAAASATTDAPARGGSSGLVATTCFAAGVGVGAAIVTVVALFGSN